jgi:3-dehydroquinate synthase
MGLSRSSSVVKASQLRLVPTLKEVRLDPQSCLVIYDRRLLKSYGAWIKKFEYRYGVQGGEELKELKHFYGHAAEILRRWPTGPRQRVVAFGGGSVGDFAGFFASIVHQGIDLVQVPSTWLAAIDSAYGGKNTLNVDGAKNLVGTFHPPLQTWGVAEVLTQQPVARVRDGYGEVVKLGLLKGGSLWRTLAKNFAGADDGSLRVLRLLPWLAEAKRQIVAKDPTENKGLRAILNLGHNLGQALEIKLNFPHGTAVGMGIRFALNWSSQSGILESETLFEELDGLVAKRLFPSFEDYQSALKKLFSGLDASRKVRELLEVDKKVIDDGKIRFIFLRRPGYPVVKRVTVDEMMREIDRQRREGVQVPRRY